MVAHSLTGGAVKPVLILLRTLETPFLVGVVVTYTVEPTARSWHVEILPALCNFSIASSADQIVISIAIFGYELSLQGTAPQWTTANQKPRLASLVLPLLALLNHPLVGDLHVIDPMLEQMFETHGLAWREALLAAV